jgi:hypothetical protein
MVSKERAMLEKSPLPFCASITLVQDVSTEKASSYVDGLTSRQIEREDFTHAKAPFHRSTDLYHFLSTTISF